MITTMQQKIMVIDVMEASAIMSPKLNARDFYSEFHGHKVHDLEVLLPKLRESSENLIWTAGDSSLDNKYWFHTSQPSVGAYREILSPPTSKCDVTYYLNYHCVNDETGRRRRMAAINAAVEATTLNERTRMLRPQDKFLRDNISRDDILVVSIGGNDVALAPTPCTICSVVGLLCLPMPCVEKGVTCGSVPVDDCCCGCGASLASCVCAFPPCLGYFRHLFGTRIEKYIEKLTSKTKPKKILVCMIYYPDEAGTPSWAGAALGALGYNSNPAKLQQLIRKAFGFATSNIRIPGSEVIPVPLFNVLDGKRSEDYIARVEPSPEGGHKMAEFILDLIDQSASRPSTETGHMLNNSTSPTPAYMKDRL